MFPGFYQESASVCLSICISIVNKMLYSVGSLTDSKVHLRIKIPNIKRKGSKQGIRTNKNPQTANPSVVIEAHLRTKVPKQQKQG